MRDSVYDLPHEATCRAVEENAYDPHLQLLEVVADAEKAIATLNRILPLLRAYRDAQQAKR